MSLQNVGKPIVFLLRVFLSSVLLWSGIAKITDVPAFYGIVKAYDILPESGSVVVAMGLPWIEVVLGICLVLGFWTRSTLLVSGMLFCVFAAALTVNIYRGADISCGCFGLDAQRGSLEMALFQDVLLMGVTFILYGVRRHVCALDNFLGVIASHKLVDMRVS